MCSSLVRISLQSAHAKYNNVHHIRSEAKSSLEIMFENRPFNANHSAYDDTDKAENPDLGPMKTFLKMNAPANDIKFGLSREPCCDGS